MESSNLVGEKIKLIRKEHKLTQIDFSKDLEISQGTLSEIESGKSKPSFDVIYILANKYHIDMNWLILNTEISTYFGNDEHSLIEKYKMLEKIAQDEVVDFIDLKLKRYQKKIYET